MAKRHLVPSDSSDRWFLFWLLTALITAFVVIVLFFGSKEVKWFHLVEMAVGLLLVWFVSYLLQSPPKDESERYTAVIANIEGIGKQLDELAKFLKTERERVTESQATLKNLQDEKTQLEPVVLAQRDTVNAVLAAYTRTTASRVWRERAIGFVMGLLASLLASLIFELARRH